MLLMYSLKQSIYDIMSLSLSIAVYDTMYLQSFLINKRHVCIVHPPPLNVTIPIYYTPQKNDSRVIRLQRFWRQGAA